MRLQIHPRASEQTRHLGPNTRPWPFVVILPSTRIGADRNICAPGFMASGKLIVTLNQEPLDNTMNRKTWLPHVASAPVTQLPTGSEGILPAGQLGAGRMPVCHRRLGSGRANATLTGPPQPAEVLTAVRRFVERIASHYAIAGVILFGSRARLTHRPDSDADVAILLQGPRRPFLQTKLAMADAAFDVLLETGINISPLPVWMDEWEHPERYANPQLLKNIAAEGIRL